MLELFWFAVNLYNVEDNKNKLYKFADYTVTMIRSNPTLYVHIDK